ncbi:MAG TPA: hypothetical protein VKF38_10045 [Anaerolineaceae bacterium]|nr:hypothetical protein [Anaerolineaceae bacterium]
MSESQIHIDLVRLMFMYVQTKFEIELGHIFLDLPESKIGSKPPIIRDFRPDLFVKTKELLIIGEAKTESDWDKKHSHEQYRAYMSECVANNSTSILLIAIPWRFERSVKSRLLHMFPINQQSERQIIVISDMVKL